MPTRLCPLLLARPWRRVASSFGVLVVAAAILPANAAAGVYLNVPIADPERPVNLPDDNYLKTARHDPSKFLDVQSFVNGITWTTWGGASATGTGTVEVNSSDTRPGHRQPYASQRAAVTITASGLASCAGQRLYTAYTLSLTGTDPEPRDFTDAQHRALPCRVQALNYYAGYERVANTTGDCLFRGVSGEWPSGFGYLAYCKMQWQGWGQSRTVGIGIARAVTLPDGCDGHHGECDYGVRVQLTRPMWCPTYGMSYTRERLEVFGSGILSSTSLIAPSEDRRLRATIGQSKPRVYYDRVKKSQRCR